ncbi:MAG TPA: YciI family protein [Rhodanobacteraceae bacterium]|nr:YciI family protein [Rhodanobacteraceae bacterium]
MAYLLLILEQRGDRDARTQAEGQAAYDSMSRWRDNLRERGLLQTAEALRPDRDGVRLSKRNGKRTLMDGPFAESKEMVGGFFLLNCRTKDEAVAIAEECPAAEYATVEVRELAPCYIR